MRQRQTSGLPFRLRPWHVCALGLGALVGILVLWFALAYGGLPRQWSRHEHKLIGERGEVVAYTAQDIPADPVNLRLEGSRDQLYCAFCNAGWHAADAVTAKEGAKIGASILLDRSYPQAPISALFLQDRMRDAAFQLPHGQSADRRHHVRFRQVEPAVWMGAAS